MREVGCLLGAGVELYGGDPQEALPRAGHRHERRNRTPRNRLTGQSMTRSITAEPSAGCLTADRFLAGRGLVHRGPPAEALALRGRVRRAADGLRGPRADRPGAPDLLGAAPARDGPGPAPCASAPACCPAAARSSCAQGTPDGRAPGRLAIRDLGVELELELSEQPGIEARCPNGRSESWTRKQAGVAGAAAPCGSTAARRVQIEALAVIDDTAGYHERVTEWRWSAGVGQRRRRPRRSPGTSSAASTTRRRAASGRCGWTACPTRSAP